VLGLASSHTTLISRCKTRGCSPRTPPHYSHNVEAHFTHLLHAHTPQHTTTLEVHDARGTSPHTLDVYARLALLTHHDLLIMQTQGVALRMHTTHPHDVEAVLCLASSHTTLISRCKTRGCSPRTPPHYSHNVEAHFHTPPTCTHTSTHHDARGPRR
jgi:hypothetical protein